jgi:hypothetical protein
LVIGPQPSVYAVRETAAGFRVEPVNARHLRSPWSVQLRLADTDPPNASAFDRKKLGDRDVRYQVTVDDEAGSGGALQKLTAVTAPPTACGSNRIVMTATQQVERPTRPDWSAAWTILAATRCVPPTR